jgi:hypothetical protein
MLREEFELLIVDEEPGSGAEELERVMKRASKAIAMRQVIAIPLR